MVFGCVVYTLHNKNLGRDQVFRVVYENRRLIENPENYDLTKDDVLLDSKPLNNIKEALVLRRFTELPKTRVYQRNTSSKSGNVYTKAI